MALAWGTLRLIGLRIEAGLDEEDVWGFGQILPFFYFLSLYGLFVGRYTVRYFST